MFFLSFEARPSGQEGHWQELQWDAKIVEVPVEVESSSSEASKNHKEAYFHSNGVYETLLSQRIIISGGPSTGTWTLGILNMKSLRVQSYPMSMFLKPEPSSPGFKPMHSFHFTALECQVDESHVAMENPK